MPVYQVICGEGVLGVKDRDELAAGITLLHTQLTGAPAIFVNVVFLPLGARQIYTAGEPSGMSFILGDIRSGRPLDVRRELICSLASLWTRVTGQPASALLVGLRETGAENAMELGLLLPQPGEEPAWLEQHSEYLHALGQL